MNPCYHIQNIDEIDSPSLVLYEDRLMHNLHKMLEMIDNDASRLMPHVKTNKMPEVIKRMVGLGIKNFKASTIAEAEIAAVQGAQSVLIAHQLVGPKIDRLAILMQQFPKTQFSTLVDNAGSLNKLQEVALKHNIKIAVYIDVNSGMDRSGIHLGNDLNQLLREIASQPSIKFLGLHVYDGHLRDPNFKDRKDKVESGMASVTTMFNQLKATNPQLTMVCGGTPAFTSHLSEKARICSPGTCVFWDWGYGDRLSEQEFQYAVLLVTRVISKPTENIITIDLGHKAVGAENPIDKRVRFLNLDGYELLSQSEEHGVLHVNHWDAIMVGDLFYGVPYHICPTVNLYDAISVIKNSNKVGEWEITARKRKITI